MKTIFAILVLSLFFGGCTAYNRSIKMKEEFGCKARATCFKQTPEQTKQINENYTKLREGMTTEEIVILIGPPQRIHSLFSSYVTWTYTSHSMATDLFFIGTQLNLRINPETNKLKYYHRAWR